MSMRDKARTADSIVSRLDARAAQEKIEEERKAEKVSEAIAAQLEDEQEEERKAERIDLLRIIREKPEAFPLEVASWNILIEMVKVKDRMGRFLKHVDQVNQEQYLTTVGRVLLCGPTALTGKTESGIPLELLTATIKTPEDLIGKFVVIQRYTGNELFFAPWPIKKLRYITATEILGVTTNPGMWMKQ